MSSHSFIADGAPFGDVTGEFTGNDGTNPGILTLDELTSFTGRFTPGLGGGGFSFGLPDLSFFSWDMTGRLGNGAADGINAQTVLGRFFRMGNGIGAVPGEHTYICSPPLNLTICGYVGTAPNTTEVPFFEAASVTTTVAQVNPVPVPASVLFLASGLVGIAVLGWRRRSG